MSRDKLPSLHDHLLVSYEVNCETREVRIRTRRATTQAENSLCEVVFTGVEGYHFENDAFGNIISALEVISVEQIISKYASQIAESYRVAGAPGPWAGDLSSALEELNSRGLRGFVLSSSYGLSGWLLAKEGRSVDAPPNLAAPKLNIPIE